MLFNLPTRGKPRAWHDALLAALSLCSLVSVLLFIHPALATSIPAKAPAPILHTLAKPPPPAVRSQDVTCLATAVYYEARGESVEGQRAVAQVILNRTRHPNFPKKVCAVVFQGANGRSGGCQFSFTCSGVMHGARDPEAWDKARAVASQALHGYVMAAIGPAINFHAVSLGRRSDAGLNRIARIGGHVFLASNASPLRLPRSVLAAS